MTEEEKLESIADVLEMEIDEISRETILEECEAWDSIAILSVISIINEEFNRFPHADEIKAYKTVGDLMDVMN